MNNFEYLYEGYGTNDTLSDNTVDFITSHRFPSYEDFDWEDTYVHNTNWKNLDSIIEKGLLIGKNTSNNFTWGVGLKSAQKSYGSKKLKDTWDGAGGCSIIFKPSEEIHKERMNDCEYGFFGDIEPNDFISIDIPFVNEGKGLRTSDVVEDMMEYGVEEVMNVYDSSFRFSFISEEQYDRLMNWCKEQL